MSRSHLLLLWVFVSIVRRVRDLKFFRGETFTRKTINPVLQENEERGLMFQLNGHGRLLPEIRLNFPKEIQKLWNQTFYSVSGFNFFFSFCSISANRSCFFLACSDLMDSIFRENCFRSV